MNLEFGQTGVYIASGTTETDAGFNVIMGNESGSSVTVTVNWKNAPVGLVIALEAGEVRYGKFTSIECTAGSVIAYK